VSGCVLFKDVKRDKPWSKRGRKLGQAKRVGWVRSRVRKRKHSHVTRHAMTMTFMVSDVMTLTDTLSVPCLYQTFWIRIFGKFRALLVSFTRWGLHAECLGTRLSDTLRYRCTARCCDFISGSRNIKTGTAYRLPSNLAVVPLPPPSSL
jgi:hypothetical protein